MKTYKAKPFFTNRIEYNHGHWAILLYNRLYCKTKATLCLFAQFEKLQIRNCVPNWAIEQMSKYIALFVPRT